MFGGKYGNLVSVAAQRPLRKPVQNLRPEIRAFSLAEVVLAIAICSFALIAIMGLFATGLRSSRESQEDIQAANLASTLISLRAAFPAGDITNLPNFAIPYKALTNIYGPAYGAGASNNYIGLDGQTTNAAHAAYGITCMAGTTSTTLPVISQVYLMLTWPPQVSPTNPAVGRYEVVTDIPLN